jgi:hypothetical protein
MATTTDLDSSPRAARVRPGLLPALAVFVVYLALILGLGELFAGDVDYQELANTKENFRDGIVIPIGIVSLLLVAVTSYFGWWKPVLFERRSGPPWLLTWPVLAIVAFVANIAVDGDQWDGGFLVLLLCGFALVGFSEELMTRGLILTGARAQYRELWAWLICTVCFGAMHGLNAIKGQDAATTIKQVFLTMAAGTLLYFARRISGTLIVSMALHALFDATLIIHGGPGAELNNDTGEAPLAAVLFQILGVIFLIIALVKHYLARANPGPEIEPLLGHQPIA